jgi:hypothetical protein
MSALATELGPLPRVQGRHRNHVLARRRKVAAVQLITEGKTYRQAADELGYANAGTVHRLVQSALAERTLEAVDDLRHRESSRLDALLESIWQRAVSGDLRAAGEARRIIEAGARLHGLYDREHKERPAGAWPCCQGPDTVVIREDDCRHRGCPSHGVFDETTMETEGRQP